MPAPAKAADIPPERMAELVQQAQDKFATKDEQSPVSQPTAPVDAATDVSKAGVVEPQVGNAKPSPVQVEAAEATPAPAPREPIPVKEHKTADQVKADKLLSELASLLTPAAGQEDKALRTIVSGRMMMGWLTDFAQAEIQRQTPAIIRTFIIDVIELSEKRYDKRQEDIDEGYFDRWAMHQVLERVKKNAVDTKQGRNCRCSNRVCPEGTQGGYGCEGVTICRRCGAEHRDGVTNMCCM